MPRYYIQLTTAVLKRIADTYYEHILPIRKQGKLNHWQRPDSDLPLERRKADW